MMVMPHGGTCVCCLRPGVLGCTGLCSGCTGTPDCDHGETHGETLEAELYNLLRDQTFGRRDE